MAYDKQTWTAREGTNLKKYTKASETATTVILTNTPDSISVAGTPFSVDRMNHIEDGIDSAHDNIDALKITDPKIYYLQLSQTPRSWAAMTTLGSDVYACVYNGGIYKQTGGTGDFISLNQTTRNWTGMTTLGSDVYACVEGGDIYKQTPTKALEVYSTAETLTNQTYLGYPVYRKVINFGALPNATHKYVAHNISGTWRLFRLMGEAYNPTTGLRFQMSYSGLPAHLYVDNTSVVVFTTCNASPWTSSYVTIEYIKAAL